MLCMRLSFLRGATRDVRPKGLLSGNAAVIDSDGSAGGTSSVEANPVLVRRYMHEGNAMGRTKNVHGTDRYREQDYSGEYLMEVHLLGLKEPVGQQLG